MLFEVEEEVGEIVCLSLCVIEIERVGKGDGSFSSRFDPIEFFFVIIIIIIIVVVSWWFFEVGIGDEDCEEAGGETTFFCAREIEVADFGLFEK